MRTEINSLTSEGNWPHLKQKNTLVSADKMKTDF